MTEEEISMGADILIFRISVITGWVVPDHKIYQKALQTDVSLKMKESFNDLTIEEVLYAMRNFSYAVEDYGKAINLQLIDKVVNLYRKSREEMSKREESSIKPEVQVLLTDEQLDNEARRDVEWSYQLFLRNNELKYPQSLERIMIIDGLMTVGELVIDKFKIWANEGKRNVYYQETSEKEVSESELNQEQKKIIKRWDYFKHEVQGSEFEYNIESFFSDLKTLGLKVTIDQSGEIEKIFKL